VTQEEAVGDYGGCCGTGDGRDRTRAPASLQDWLGGRDPSSALSSCVARCASFRLSCVFRFSPRFSATSSLPIICSHSISLPLPSLLPCCLPISRLQLTLYQLWLRLSTLYAWSPTLLLSIHCLSFPLTRAVNEIHTEDINRHSLPSRYSFLPCVRDVRTKSAFALRNVEMRETSPERAAGTSRTSFRLNYRHVIPLTMLPDSAHTDIATLSPTLSALHVIAPSWLSIIIWNFDT